MSIIREHIEVFTGNRAEFTILFPLIESLAEQHHVNLLVSGTHLFNQWGTNQEIFDKVYRSPFSEFITIHLLTLPHDMDQQHFPTLIPSISQAYIKYRETVPEIPKFSLILGDRIETFVYAMTAFYHKNILVHVAGGDITLYPVFDSNVRHSITKISHLHLVTNAQSFDVVKSFGEELWRIKNVGMPSLDSIYRQNLYSEMELRTKFGLKSNKLVIATYHVDQFVPLDENIISLRKMIHGLQQVDEDVIVTFPNNDPGHVPLIEFLESDDVQQSALKVVKNLGLDYYISCLAHLNVILIGNSSSLVTESSFFKVPALLLGKRQHMRLKGLNVTELLEFTEEEISSYITTTFACYPKLMLSQDYILSQHIYGSGESCRKTLEFLHTIFTHRSRDEILMKRLTL